MAPFMSMPSREAPPMPPKNDSGTETTSAHGHETTRKVSARSIHLLQRPHVLGVPMSMETSGGIIASTTAPITTQGVYQREKRVMKFSALAFFSEEFSTSSRIFATVLSSKRLCVLTWITPERFIVPLVTLSPTVLSAGRLSPVRAAVLTEVEPSIISPSSGIFSPGLITIVSPSSTSSGDTVSSFPSRTTTA